MAKKPLQISSFSTLESNLYILALVTTLPLNSNSFLLPAFVCHQIKQAKLFQGMFIQPFVGKYAHALPVQLAGWVRARCKLHTVYTWTGHHGAWMDGLWSGHQVGLTPLGSHWAQPSLAHRVGRVRVRVPSKHPVHTALAAALRESLLLCVHSSTVLQIWLHLFWAGLVTRLPK